MCEELDIWAQAIVDRVKDDRDLVVIVSGKVGSGKSKLILALVAFHLCPKLGIKFDPGKHVYVGDSADEFMDMWIKGEQFHPLVADEAIDFFYAGDWMKAEQKRSKEEMERIRSRNRIVFLNIPRLLDLSKGVRDRRADVWIRVFSERGVCAINVASDNEYDEDPWCVKDGKTAIGSKRDTISQLQAMMRLRTYCDHFTFPDWVGPDGKPHPVWKSYLKHKEKMNQLTHEKRMVDLAKKDALKTPMVELKREKHFRPLVEGLLKMDVPLKIIDDYILGAVDRSTLGKWALKWGYTKGSRPPQESDYKKIEAMWKTFLKIKN